MVLDSSEVTVSGETTTVGPDQPESESKEEPKFESGDIGFILLCTGLVWLMIPGLGFYYAGMLRAKSALSIILICVWSSTIVSIQWFVVGYSLTFSRTASFIIGNFDNVLLQGTYDEASVGSDKIPGLLFCLYQGMFAGIAPALAVGAGAERARFLPVTIFIVLWTTLVYDFLACWTWNPNGWSAVTGGLDFAGGTPVHISSGAAGLAIAIMSGRRRTSESDDELRPHNLSYTFLGTMLLWFGWFGFNAGSALSPTIQAVTAGFVTNLSASMGAVTWVIVDYVWERKYSPLGFCSGAVAGLVVITPACGYVGPCTSIIFGLIGALVCNFSVRLIHLTRIDDPVEVVGVHGVGGLLGSILTGFAAQKVYAPDIEGGWLDGNPMQVIHQLLDCAAGFGWSFVISLLILALLNAVGLEFRLDSELERDGLDKVELGSSCYDYHEDLKVRLKKQIRFGNTWYGGTREGEPGNEFVIGYFHRFGNGSELDYATQLEKFCRTIKRNKGTIRLNRPIVSPVPSLK